VWSSAVFLIRFPQRAPSASFEDSVPCSTFCGPKNLERTGSPGAGAQGEVVSNHDELMCNFFAQADALAVGKSAVELQSEGITPSLIPHKTFTGNRPSTSILLPALNAYTTGQLLALYEHRIAVEVGISLGHSPLFLLRQHPTPPPPKNRVNKLSCALLPPRPFASVLAPLLSRSPF
jgi:Phosphoglucose isomerase